jgi:Flp pilus assembly secretin CpaC
MWKIVLPVLLAVAVPVVGQETTPAALEYGVTPAPPPSRTSLSKADNLNIAADHLEAAGFHEEAARFYREEAKERARLRNLPKPAQVLVHLRTIEIPRSHLSNVDSQPYGGEKGTSLAAYFQKLLGSDSGGFDPKLVGLIDRLRKEKLVQVQSEPDIVTLDGRPACIKVGGEIGYEEKDADGKKVMKYKEYGTRVDVLAQVVDKRIRLDLRYRLSEPDLANSINGVPALRSREVETGVTLEQGKTLALCGLVHLESKGKRSEQMESVMMVNAEIVKPDDAKRLESVTSVGTVKTLSKSDHLDVAAEHLEAAGLKDEAQQFRQDKAEERAHRRSETAQIVAHVRMLEFSHTELSELDSQPYGGNKGTSVMELLAKLNNRLSLPGADNVLRLPAPTGGNAARAASSGPTFRSLIKALCKEGHMHTRAEPDLMATFGRPTYILDGGEIGYRTKDADGKETVSFKEYGTRVDLLAVRLPSGRIHLDCRLRVSEPDAENSVDGIPAVRSREVETGVEFKSGETIVIGGLREARTRVVAAPPAAGDKPEKSGRPKELHITEEIETMFMVTADLVTEGSADTANAKPTVQR